MKSIRVRCLIILVASSLTACSSLFYGEYGSRTGVSGSLVDYLYPNGEIPTQSDSSTPRLNLPLRVGLAFVPTNSFSGQPLSEATKSDLLGKVKTAFQSRDYIEHIEVIPDTYLRSSSGFQGMQQVARLYGVDVMALVSYDQVTATDDTKASLLYWTIVGAYIIEGTENQVQTFIDTAVFDVSTKQLLFRAPGTDKRESRSTLIESNEDLRNSRTLGFVGAMDDMTVNLTSELERFEMTIVENPSVAEVTWEKGKGGGGAIGLFWLGLLSIVFFRRRQVWYSATL